MAVETMLYHKVECPKCKAKTIRSNGKGFFFCVAKHYDPEKKVNNDCKWTAKDYLKSKVAQKEIKAVNNAKKEVKKEKPKDVLYHKIACPKCKAPNIRSLGMTSFWCVAFKYNKEKKEKVFCGWKSGKMPKAMKKMKKEEKKEAKKTGSMIPEEKKKKRLSWLRRKDN